MRKKQRRIMVISSIVLVILTGLYLHALCQKFPQMEIPLTEFYGKEEQNLKDFKNTKEGLISVSSDPWVEYHLKEKTKIRMIELEFSNVTRTDLWGEVFDMDTGKSHSYDLKNGKVFLSYKNEKQDFEMENFRFDLVSMSDVQFQLDHVILNSKYGMARDTVVCFFRIWLILLLFEELLFAVFHEKRKEPVKRYITFFIPMAAVIQIVVYSYNILVNKVEGSLQIWMYLLLVCNLLLAILGIKKCKSEFWKRSFYIFLSVLFNIGFVEILSGTEYDFTNMQAGIFNIVVCGVLVHLLILLFSGKVKAATGSMNVLMVVLGIINHYFYQFRGNPFELSDLTMAGEAVTVLKNYKLLVDNRMLFAILAEVNMVLAAKVADIGKIQEKKEKRASVLLTFALFLGAFINMPDVSYWNMAATAKEYGYLNSFVTYARRDFKHKKPEGYSLKNAKNILLRYKEQEGSKTPNVIVIMNESFADLPKVYGFETNTDGMPYIHSLEENVIKGDMLVSVFGGTTANTEYEFLTGNSMAFFQSGSVPYMQSVKRKQQSIAWELGQYDYQRIAFHPYTGENYNRHKVYPLLGFDSYLSIEDKLSNTEQLRSYVSDVADVKNIIDIYEKREKDEPFFLFNVTMQNHGGYSENESQIDLTVMPVEKKLQFVSLMEYLSLVKASDEAFYELTSYFAEEEEDTIILMFGDHQPGLDMEVYETLDPNLQSSMEEKMKLYTVPFVMWANFDIDSKQEVLTSPNYLRAMLLEQAGMPLSNYDLFLLDCSKQYPAMNALGYYDAEGKIHDISEAENERKLNEYQKVQYANVYDKRFMVN